MLLLFWNGTDQVVVPPEPQPEQIQAVTYSGGPYRPTIQFPVIGNINGVLPHIIGDAIGFVPRIDGQANIVLRNLISGDADGIIPNYGFADGGISVIKGSARGAVKFLHDDEEILLFVLMN